MSFYTNPDHRTSTFDRIEIGREFEGSGRNILDMESVSDDSSSDHVNVFVVFVFILDILVLAFIAVLEFFLRFTNVFPVRHVNFSCKDESISYPAVSNLTYQEFAYHADVSFEVIISLTFCIPPFVITVGELALWAFTEEDQKTVRVLCQKCRMPQVVRRILRFIGAFLFGLLLTMVFADVSKIMVGRLRPTFLSVCQPNYAECGTPSAGMYDENICTETNKDKIRQARLSFPSLHAAVTSFAAIYLAIYLHNTIRAHSVRLMRPFVCLSFIMLSVLCAVARYGLYQNHWTDILAGFLLGATFAIYIGVFVLNNFREYLSSKKLYLRLRNFFAEQRAMELRDLYKEESYSKNPWWGSIRILSPGVPLQEMEGPKPQADSLPALSIAPRKDRLERYSYFGIPAYQNTAIDNQIYQGGVTIPRPSTLPNPPRQQVTSHHGMQHQQPNGGVSHILNESSTDPPTTFPVDYHQREYRQREREFLARERELERQRKLLRPQDTFQRDLKHTLNQFRRESDEFGPGHM